MSDRSTKSFAGLNGDRELSRPQKVAWLAGNAGDGIVGELMATSPPGASVVSPAAFSGGEGLHWEESTGRSNLASSPGRLLGVHTTLAACRRLGGANRPLHVLDLGCGTGGFLPFFRTQLPGFASFTGVDVLRRPAWDELGRAPDATFHEATAEAFVDGLTPADRFDVVHTHSALEHMPGDLHVMRTLGAWARAAERPIAHIHIVPGTAALALYRTHGYRTYSRRDIARFVEELAPGRVWVVPLGGRRSWLLHQREIDRRDRDPAGYGQRLLDVCAHDLRRTPRLPIMWALIVIPPEWDAGA